MAQNEVSHPINVTLDGQNYLVWTHSMHNFLKGKQLCLYLTVELKKLVKGASESDDLFQIRFVDWDVNKHQILTWLCNTSISPISNLPCIFVDAKSI